MGSFDTTERTGRSFPLEILGDTPVLISLSFAIIKTHTAGIPLISFVEQRVFIKTHTIRETLEQRCGRIQWEKLILLSTPNFIKQACKRAVKDRVNKEKLS